MAKTSKRCLQCDRLLDQRVAQGLCPRCLLLRGMEVARLPKAPGAPASLARPAQPTARAGKRSRVAPGQSPKHSDPNSGAGTRAPSPKAKGPARDRRPPRGGPE